MFILGGTFEIGSFKFSAINEIEIIKSVDDISDTAVIKMPSKFLVKQNGGLKYTEEVIKKGDPVKITLAYKGKFEKVEFEGYVDRIKAGVPMEIHCVDATWLLRRKECKFSKSKTSLKEVLQHIVEGTDLKLATNIPDLPLEKYLLKNKNGLQALYQIKEETSMSIYLNDAGELYCGLQQLNNIGQIVKYDLNYNLVENNLEFRTADDKKIKVVYESTTKDNKKLKVELGDDGGEKIEVKTKTITDQATLERMAKTHLERAKYDGYDGDVTSFLIPYATRGMAAEIIDKKHVNRQGKYFIKKVVTTFGTGGARRKVSISNKL
ncbi:hypothetical protein [Sphingobacterium multivorum]|uniref:hypothetical protein n=1 Tax=Sphingobacterium multivorum TaxID=28454 RepID=UPI00289EF8D9|nr:hypothetical protein [Sphingobacterium multivorum]